MITVTNSINQYIETSNVQLFVKREDKIHETISGNKFRKLKYNLLEAQKHNYDTLLTFGGAYSNHILAVAATGKEFGYKTIGVIRGEELEHKNTLNSTLKSSKDFGMQLHFVDRKSYREKDSLQFKTELSKRFGKVFIIPEGGTNDLAVKGCKEILTSQDYNFDHVCCAVGTGGTITGLINSAKAHQKILGFPALKGDFLKDEISKFANSKNWQLMSEYHFGGYAKINVELISFINWFKDTHGIPLDPIYTGKMMFGIFDLIKKGFFKETDKILAIHTGGLQGIEGMNTKLKKKNLPLIQ